MNAESLDRLSRAVREVGFPTAVAGVLLWAFLVRMPADMLELRRAIDRNTEALVALERGHQALLTAVRR